MTRATFFGTVGFLFLMGISACAQNDETDISLPVESESAGGRLDSGKPETEAIPETDLLTFAQGAIPVSVGGTESGSGASFEDAVMMIDGDAGSFVVGKVTTDEAEREFVFRLPAQTTFDLFFVPVPRETPSPSQTFTKNVTVFGSATGPDYKWIRLASAVLNAAERETYDGQLEVHDRSPVIWVKVVLDGGVSIETEKSFLEFSEIIGYGVQEEAELTTGFNGIWKIPGSMTELKQQGAVVTGCYDRNGRLQGTVSGNILRATGQTPDDEAVSLFILGLVEENSIRGVRSTNGAPFRLWTGPVAPDGSVTECTKQVTPVLGCGSVVHGINFEFDSAVISGGSSAVLDDLYTGLAATSQSRIQIVGHTSSEGSNAYNLELSRRRAQAVVDDLVRRGIPTSRLAAIGAGESQPIASNDTEHGRAMNRRVEIVCTEGL